MYFPCNTFFIFFLIEKSDVGMRYLLLDAVPSGTPYTSVDWGMKDSINEYW